LNILNSYLSKNCYSIISADKFIKEINRQSDRATIRKYFGSRKLYKNK